jgi:hypothetical protein
MRFSLLTLPSDGRAELRDRHVVRDLQVYAVRHCHAGAHLRTVQPIEEVRVPRWRYKVLLRVAVRILHLRVKMKAVSDPAQNFLTRQSGDRSDECAQVDVQPEKQIEQERPAVVEVGLVIWRGTTHQSHAIGHDLHYLKRRLHLDAS